MTFTIATAADAGYFPLLQDLVNSIRDKAQGRDVPLSVLDVGLRPDQLAWLAGQRANVVAPGWDVEFPGMERTPPVLRAQVSRPFLRKHFPGYDAYLWIDADAWVQDWAVLDLYLSVAQRGDLAIAAEIDRAYKRHYKRPKILGWTLTHKCYREAFGWRIAERYGRNPMLNVGVFALRADAPHWETWIRLLTQVLQRTRFVFVEQIALNYGVFALGLPANILPAYCNWMVGDAAPAYDDAGRCLVEPFAPYAKIGIVHLAGADQKTKEFTLVTLGGGSIRTTLRYGQVLRHVGGHAMSRATSAITSPPHP